MLISFVVAMDENRLIGADNQLPWRLPDDMRWFRQQTMGKPIIMGRKTYESIPSKFRPLSGRHNIILTHDLTYHAPGCTIVHSIETALEAAENVEEIIVGGGATLYEQFWPYVNRLYLTRVNGRFQGNIHFPKFEQSLWEIIYQQEHAADDQHQTSFTWFIMEKQ